MSIKRIVKNLLQIWKNKWKILEGLWNNFHKKRFVERIAAERMKMCLECPFIDIKGKDCAVPGTQPCCSICGCSLAIKVRSLSSECPKEYWRIVMTEEEEDKFNLNR